MARRETPENSATISSNRNIRLSVSITLVTGKTSEDLARISCDSNSSVNIELNTKLSINLNIDFRISRNISLNNDLEIAGNMALSVKMALRRRETSKDLIMINPNSNISPFSVRMATGEYFQDLAAISPNSNIGPKINHNFDLKTSSKINFII